MHNRLSRIVGVVSAFSDGGRMQDMYMIPGYQVTG